MRTAFYTVALGAALLLTGTEAQARRKGCSPRSGIAPADVSSLCAGVKPGGGTRSRLFAVPYRRTLRWLFDNSVEGHLDRRSNAPGTFINSAPSHVRQRRRLHETASWRGQRPCRGAIAFIASPAWRLAAPSVNGDGSRREANTRPSWRKAGSEKPVQRRFVAGRRTSMAQRRSAPWLSPQATATIGGSGLLEGALLKGKDRRGAKC